MIFTDLIQVLCLAYKEKQALQYHLDPKFILFQSISNVLVELLKSIKKNI